MARMRTRTAPLEREACGPPPSVVSSDVGARLTGDRGFQATNGRDDDLFTSSLQELDGSAHLRTHTAFGEFASFEIAANLGQTHAIEVALIGLAKVDGHPLHAGRDHQQWQ